MVWFSVRLSQVPNHIVMGTEASRFAQSEIRTSTAAMRTFISLLSIAAALLVGCRGRSSDATGVPLSFYIVSSENVVGGRFIDTPDFPKLGYIGPKPDLVVTRLETVAVDVSPPFSKARPAINIAMHSGDAPQFTALTEQAIEKKLLVMLGDTPLTAPLVKARIPTANVMLTFGEGTDSKKVADGLKRLIQ
jgi:hypothetical protein